MQLSNCFSVVLKSILTRYKEMYDIFHAGVQMDTMQHFHTLYHWKYIVLCHNRGLKQQDIFRDKGERSG